MLIITILLLLVAGVVGWVYLADPFSRFTVIKLSFAVAIGTKVAGSQFLAMRQALLERA